jgi:hypothetical protein
MGQQSDLTVVFSVMMMPEALGYIRLVFGASGALAM